MAQEIYEEMMIAVPCPLFVSDRKKEVLLIQPCEHIIAIALLCNSITQAGIHTLKDRGHQKKLLDALRKLSQDLFSQIMQHRPMCASKGCDKTRYLTLIGL